MEAGDDSTKNNDNLDERDAASGTEEECRDDAEAIAITEEGSAESGTMDFDDTSFDVHLEELDWESDSDPFDADEWEMIRRNLEH